MALPNEPLTRGEQYLNRIATGEGTIPDEPLTRMEQYLDYIAENGGSGGGGSDPSAVKKISLSDLPNVGNGTYTLGVVDVTAPIQFPRIQNRGIIIVDTVFNIKTPILFPPYRNDSYFTLPCFVGCTFNNSLGSRVLISSGGTNIVGSRVTGCNFFNVDYAASSYLQDFNFVNCYIQSYQTFLDNPTSTVQARFVNCDAEAESKALVNAKNAYIYASGTYEGNGARNEYHFNASYGVFNFTNCWLESEKLLSLTGGTSVVEKTTINMVGCNVQINATPMVVVTNPQYVNLFIDGSVLVPQNGSARFIDKTASQMMSVIGDFVRASADAGYVKPIGGVVAEDKKIATLSDINALESKRFFYQQITLSSAVIQSGGVDITLPVGAWIVVAGRGGGGYAAATVQLVTAETNTAYTTTSILPIIPTTPSNEGYVGNLAFTATKANASDVTFTLNINSNNEGYAASFKISAIRLY